MLVPTVFGLDKGFIKIFKPYSYQDYISAVKSEFNISDLDGTVELKLNSFNIKDSQFKDIVLQYCNDLTFKIDVSIKASFVSSQVSSKLFLSDCEIGDCVGGDISFTNLQDQRTSEIPAKKTLDENSIKLLPTIGYICRKFEKEKRLKNRDRVKIAKTIVDECIKDKPDKLLTRVDFLQLAESIIRIFPSETAGSYFIPSVRGIPARGKLYNAYNNKRAELREKGIITRRSLKRKSSNGFDRNSFSENEIKDDVDFLKQNCDDWTVITIKWEKTFCFRKKELSSSISTKEYLNTYPALQCVNGTELATLDAKKLHPSIGSIENWNEIFGKVVDYCGKFKDAKVQQLLKEIETSSNEDHKAQLAFNLIPYILPHVGKRSENSSKRATKQEIHQRFMHQFSSLIELNASERKDVHIRFVNDGTIISYAEFNIAGKVFKYKNLKEALNSAFMYIAALNVAYPKLCLHVWQFVQLAIFKVDLLNEKVPFIESFISDLGI